MTNKPEQADDNLGFTSLVRALDEKWGHTYIDEAPGNNKAEAVNEGEDEISTRQGEE